MKARFEFPSQQTKQSETIIGLASPRDRLAAVIVDVTLLLPLVQLCQAPLKKWILESYLFDGGQNVSLYRFMNLFVFVFIFIIYHTFMVYKKGQTLGKMFFKIKVISYHGYISFYSSFLRSVSIFIEIIFFGIPFMSIFSHGLRRPLHDRISDTLVVSTERRVGFPSLGERWRAKLGTLFLGISFFVSFSFYVLVMPSWNSPDELSKQEKCFQELDQVESDLESSIALYIMKKIDSDCLHDLAREKVWEKPSSLAHFAMSLSYYKQKELSNQYLEKVCERPVEPDLCTYSRWLMTKKSFKNMPAEMFAKISDVNETSDLIKVIVATHLLQEGQYDKVAQLLKAVQRKEILEPLLASMSFQVSLALGHFEQGYWIMQTHAVLGLKDVFKFVRYQVKTKNISYKEQIKVLEYFYPTLKEGRDERSLASYEGVDEEVVELYRFIKEVL